MKLAADDLRDEVLGRLDEVVFRRRPIERRNPGHVGSDRRATCTPWFDNGSVYEEKKM